MPLKCVLMPAASLENGSSCTLYTAEQNGGAFAMVLKHRKWQQGDKTILVVPLTWQILCPQESHKKCFEESSITTLLLVVWWTSRGGPQSDVGHTFQTAVGPVSGLTWSAARLVLWLQVTPPQPVYNVCSVFMVSDGCVGPAGPS